MTTFALYCKSYRTDLNRVLRLAKSIEKFNTERIPFFLSVPASDFELFQQHLKAFQLTLIRDESIIEASPRITLSHLKTLQGNVAQQVIKAEFWRLGHSQAYLCLDSDALFIRPFERSDFLSSNGTPYTMMDEGHDLLESAFQNKRLRIVSAFCQEAGLVQKLFQRTGRRYSFGPFPLVWHSAVWNSLDIQFLQPKGMNLVDAIAMAPIESRWYGEALLAFKAIDILPCQAMFKVYHYAWQLDKEVLKATEVAHMYCGVIYQSSWERELDWPREGGRWYSRLGRRLRRMLGRI